MGRGRKGANGGDGIGKREVNTTSIFVEGPPSCWLRHCASYADTDACRADDCCVQCAVRHSSAAAACRIDTAPASVTGVGAACRVVTAIN